MKENRCYYCGAECGDSSVCSDCANNYNTYYGRDKEEVEKAKEKEEKERRLNDFLRK